MQYVSIDELKANLLYAGSPFARVKNHQGEDLTAILKRIPRAPMVPLDEYGKLYAQCENALSRMADAERRCRIVSKEAEKLSAQYEAALSKMADAERKCRILTKELEAARGATGDGV